MWFIITKFGHYHKKWKVIHWDKLIPGGGVWMKRLYLTGISALLLMTLPGCDGGSTRGRMDDGYQPMYRDGQTTTRFGRVSNDGMNGHERFQGGGQNEIGYFHYNPADYRSAPGSGSPGPNVFIDRPLLAKNVAYLVTVLPNVKEATALVTDDHIFVGVQPKNGALDAKTLKEAKRTAESVTPRYYQVRVTSDQELQEEIDSVGMKMRDSSNVEGRKGDLEQLLRNMGDETPPDVNESIYPQGRHQINPQQR
jgi:hypothetical protein